MILNIFDDLQDFFSPVVDFFVNILKFDFALISTYPLVSEFIYC